MPGPTVRSLHRYPVKSLAGETVGVLDLDARGGVGDRVWSVRTQNGKIGSGKDGRRFAAVRGLLEVRATALDGTVTLTFPDGSTAAVHSPEAADRLSAHVGEPVTLAYEDADTHFDDGPVSLIGTVSIDAVTAEMGTAVDPARFRPNIVLDTATAYVEDGWVGRRIRVGTAVLAVEMASPRCVMVNMATADLPALPGTLKAVAVAHDTCLGVIARVVEPGRIGVGDRVTVH